MDADIDVDGLITTIEEPGVSGMLVMGQPHGVWLYVHGEDVRVVRWRYGEIVDVLTSPLTARSAI